MKNIYSNIINFNNNSLTRIKKILKNNGLIAFPTETVYGLACNSYSFLAVKKIYKIKKRPLQNPLIIHYHSLNQASKDVIFTKDFLILFKKFCPGPITFILKKRANSKVQKNATAFLNTVAIRFPKHKVIREILRKIDFPLAMPSANISGSVSPTKPEHILKDFGKKIKIINGGSSEIGLESTVVDLSEKIQILRPGSISLNEIEKCLKKKINFLKSSKKIRSPGNIKYHYSPGIPIKLNAKKPKGNSAFIMYGKKTTKKKNYFNLSRKSNLKEIAKNLYKTFIDIKNKNYKKIYVMRIPNKGVGTAIIYLKNLMIKLQSIK